MTIRHLIQGSAYALFRSPYCATFRIGFLVVAVLGLTSQILYDRHPITAVTVFPQWLLLGSIWYSWQQDLVGHPDNRVRETLVFALLIPALSCLALLIAWFGWKANTLAIGGVIPVSDSASY